MSSLWFQRWSAGLSPPLKAEKGEIKNCDRLGSAKPLTSFDSDFWFLTLEKVLVRRPHIKNQTDGAGSAAFGKQKSGKAS